MLDLTEGSKEAVGGVIGEGILWPNVGGLDRLMKSINLSLQAIQIHQVKRRKEAECGVHWQTGTGTGNCYQEAIYSLGLRLFNSDWRK